MKPDLTNLPPEWPEALLPGIRESVLAAKQSIVVLDDDPTGTQTVYDTPVLTAWSPAILTNEFARETPLFYILTNTRGYPPDEVVRINREIADGLQAAYQRTGRSYTVISRSDSTLRGHYPLETDVLTKCLELSQAACVIIPFFLEGGRLTLNDTHYVVENDQWTPAAETPFAKDAVFGFTHSNLRDWVEEKTQGRVAAADVVSVDLVTIREQGPNGVAERLGAVAAGGAVVVNALTMRDMEVVVAGCLAAERAGVSLIYRTAASFVRARAGLEKKPLLAGHDLIPDPSSAGGLVVVGSHVPKTTQQLQHLLDSKFMHPVELDVRQFLAAESKDAVVKDLAGRLDQQLSQGTSCVLYTSRELVTHESDAANLELSQHISNALVQIVQALATRPRYLVAKGGITSSDVATKALGIRRAMVKGQILPGIPVWTPDENATFPGLCYVVFPGNVGSNEALLEAVQKLEMTS